MYNNPNISYPESLSVVAFLIDRYSFAKLRDFLTLSARSSGYRSALERAFEATPDELEQAVAGLAARISERRLPPQCAERLRSVAGRGAAAPGPLYRGADRAGGCDQLAEHHQPDRRCWIRPARCWSGAPPDRAPRRWRTRPAPRSRAPNMRMAADLVGRAQQAYVDLDDPRQAAVLATYAERAQRGLRATATLDEAQALVGDLAVSTGTHSGRSCRRRVYWPGRSGARRSGAGAACRSLTNARRCSARCC